MQHALKSSSGLSNDPHPTVNRPGALKHERNNPGHQVSNGTLGHGYQNTLTKFVS